MCVGAQRTEEDEQCGIDVHAALKRHPLSPIGAYRMQRMEFAI